MWDMPLAASIDRLYNIYNRIPKSTVYACVESGMISAADYEKITGEPYAA